MEEQQPITKVFALACELGSANGWENISLQPGCQELSIDEHWWFALNPHRETIECSKGVKVPAYSIYFEFNGWPAGECTSLGGVIAFGARANEDTLIAALENAMWGKGSTRW
jgi:hypothetical protein